MKRAFLWLPLLAMVAGCGGSEPAATVATVVAAPADLSGVTVEVHQVPG